MSDWFDLTMDKNLVVERVSTSDIDEVLGTLEGVDRKSTSIECGYYTDTRTSGSMTVVGDGYVRDQFLRPVIEVPAMGHRRELGLYLVKADPATRPVTEWEYRLELQSMLYGLSTDKAAKPWVMAKNSKALTAIGQMLSTCGRPWVNHGANDYMYKSAKVMDAGGSYLSRLFELCKQANDRLDVDGHGRVTVSPYVQPSAKTPSFTLDMDDPRGIVAGISRSSDYASLPGRVVVHCKYTETVNSKSVEREIVGQADATGHSSSKVRGYMVTDFRDMPDMTPRTAARANQLAKEYLQRDLTELVEWEVETPYLPLWEGDVVELVVHDGLTQYVGRRKCLVKNMTIDLLHFGMKMTLKEVTSGDWERGG